MQLSKKITNQIEAVEMSYTWGGSYKEFKKELNKLNSLVLELEHEQGVKNEKI